MTIHQCQLALAVLFLSPLTAQAAPQDRVGDAYEITLTQDSKVSGAQSGSSHDDWQLMERVLALRDGGVELEYDLPADVPAQQREQAWHFPARVFHAPDRPLQLLNASDAELRLHAWLGDRASALCGHWAFGWTAQYFDCDPQSVLQDLGPYLRPANVSDGLPYHQDGARADAMLHAVKNNPDGVTLVANMEIDPEPQRLGLAQTDIAIAEITRHETLTLEAALRAHAADRISGTIVVTIETDSNGRPLKRTSVAEVDIDSKDGSHRHDSTTQTVEWRLVPR